MTRTALARRLLPAAVATATGAMTIGAAVLAPAASASSKFHTSLSIRSVRQSVASGGQDTISGILLAQGRALPHRTVTLQDRTRGATAWADEAADSTNSHGRAAFVIHPTQTARYRLVYAGSQLFQAARSGVVTVTVKPPRTATTLSISAAQTTIDYGQSDTVSGTLTDASGQPLAGDTVILRHNPAGGRKPSRLAKATTDSTGSVSFTVTPRVTNTYRLVFKGTAADAPTASQAQKVIVRQPTSLSIGERTRSNGSPVIFGTLRGTRAPARTLPGRLVTLQSSPAGAGTFSEVATARTGKNGYVAFPVTMPTAATDYRLVFAGGPYRTGSTSVVVTVGGSSVS